MSLSSTLKKVIHLIEFIWIFYSEGFIHNEVVLTGCITKAESSKKKKNLI